MASLDFLKPFLPEHQPLFEAYRSHRATELAHGACKPHLIWSDLLEYRWAILADMFCLFATSHGVTHLALSPFGAGCIREATALAFEHIARMNPSHIPSRMDNVDESTSMLLRTAGYAIAQISADYLYQREDIVALSGNKFRAQRAAANQAARCRPLLCPFLANDTEACLTVFDRWASDLAETIPPSLNRMMREDARFAHHRAMRQSTELGLTGGVVAVDGVIAGYTFGFPLSADTFCVLMEIADKSIRGLSAWLFREFCRELSPYKFINTMDDSGLAGLSHSKALWHPVRMIPSYTVTKNIF